jgi:hypothetical protein
LVRILPGVEIQVVKEIVPQQLHPSGVVGLIGTAEKGPLLTSVPVTSYREYQEKFGSDTAFSMTKEARACFMNGVFEIFATRIEAAGSNSASTTLKDIEGEDALKLEAKAVGEAGNKVRYAVAAGAIEGAVSIQVSDGAKFEAFDTLETLSH